jgi:hypothetical protein
MIYILSNAKMPGLVKIGPRLVTCSFPARCLNFIPVSERSLNRGIIQEHAVSYTLKTLKCLVIQNRIEQGDLK